MRETQLLSDKSSHRIERRPDARIVRSALDEVKAIQTLLADVYKDVGDGRTLLRELVQNADDAEAKRLVFTIVDVGWPKAQNSLLSGPALVVANNGPFPEKDHKALHQALGGAKADEAGKIGRFGIGIKSVFHICEAIVYIGADQGVLRPGALNPWAGTGPSGDADPLHHDWDSVGDDDLDRLLGMAKALLGGFHNGLLQWIPLRKADHLDRAQDGKYGLGQSLVNPNDVAGWFEGPESLVLLLAQCGHLLSIEADRASDPHKLESRHKLVHVVRPHSERPGWIGRYEEDTDTKSRHFEGQIKDDSRSWSVLGVETLGHDSLRELRDKSDWPSDPHWRDGRCVWVPRKALAHAAITVLRPDDSPSDLCAARFRWAVFLPLDNDPHPRSSDVVETLGKADESGAWDIVLHGYFWPSHDRMSIPGVTDDECGTGDSAVRIRWNQGVRDELLLPLFPQALAAAVRDIPGAVARSLLELVTACQTVRSNLSSVTRQDLLLPVVTENGVGWKVVSAHGLEIISIPGWSKAPISFRRHFLTKVNDHASGIVIIEHDAPRLGGHISVWPRQWVEVLLSCIPSKMLQSPEELEWVRGLLVHLLGSPSDAVDSQTAEVTSWLVSRIAEGALGVTMKGPATEEQKDLRYRWMRLFAALPQAWLISTPLAAQRAVVELAKDGVIGAGLMPVPLGYNEDIDRSSRPDPQRLDGALLTVGKRLLEEGDTSQVMRSSRLLLAEALISVRGIESLSEELSGLPLLRAKRLPENRDDAWSVAELQRRKEQHRVFAKPADDVDGDGSALDVPSDPKKAVVELAEGLDEAAWLVDSPVASVAHIPIPSADALALAVIDADIIGSVPEKRLGLLQRLAQFQGTTSPTVRRSIIALLTGQVSAEGDDQELYFVRTQDTDRAANQRSLGILLQVLRRSWCEVEASLVEPLPHDLVFSLCIKTVDFGILHKLLQESLDESSDWSGIDRDEAIHLLKRLHSADSEYRRRWRQMPLHRRVGGDRGKCDERTLKAVGNLRLPPELEDEIWLLDPDQEVANLYFDIPPLDDNGVLRAMLQSQRPYQFADRIVRALRAKGQGRIILPDDPTLRNLLHNAAWLPHRDGDSGVTPKELLVLPQDLQSILAPLARAGALGNHHLVEDLDNVIWGDAKDAVEDILGRPSPTRQIQLLANALDSSMVSSVDDGAYVLLPDAGRVDVHLVEDGLRSPLVDSHRGWALVRAAFSATGVEIGKPLDEAPAVVREAVVGIARSLCAKVPASRQISSLMNLASARPARDSSAGRLFRSILETFAQTNVFFDHVLPNIELPTQDGQWRQTRDIARSASGVARSHRLLTELRDPLYLNIDTPVPLHHQSGRPTGADSADILTKYFDPWINRLPGGAVGAFLALLGDGKDNTIFDLSQRWLGEDVSVEGMRLALDRETGRDPCASVRVFVSGNIASGQNVEALNLLGERVEMNAGSEDDAVFAADPVRRSSMLGDFWEITFRDVEPHRRTAEHLIALLGNTVEWWAVRVLRIEQQTVRSWWVRWATGSQAQVGPVQASILAHLPLTLHQLDVRECTALRNALQDAQRAQRRREQAPPAQINDAIRTERLALDKLASLIRDEPEHHRFIWTRVQEMMKRFGYSEDSVLLELAQNADDALVQAVEILGRALSPAACRLIVRVVERDQRVTIDVIHYGRPINDTGGAAFPDGRDRQWDQDLYFMMLLNLSGKPGEISGQSTPASTTGRFGLGFKSVHLVSETPSVVSGFLAFSIAAGLLPIEQPLSDDPDLQAADVYRGTRVRLPLRGNGETSDLIEKIFRRFDYARTLLPAFAREIREVVVDGGPHAGTSTFDGEPIDGAPGWSVGKGTVGLPGHGQRRLLRFRPADASIGHGTEALVVGLWEGLPEPFPADMPFLWNVTPTSEGWGCGYAVNGSFKLDPGRTHVSLEDAGTRRVVDILGEALGRGLAELHDTLLNGGSHTATGLPSGVDATEFVAKLWRVLVAGIDNGDDLRKRLLLRLHGPGRGLSLWMSARSVVPSGLPAPFQSRLPALTTDTQIEVAAGGLDNPGICQAIAQVDELVSLAQRHRVVSSDVAQYLRPLLGTIPRQFWPWEILQELTERWDHILTPERLHALRPFAEESVWKAIPNNPQGPPWHSKLLARSVAGSSVPLRSLLLPRKLDSVEVDEAVKDELLRAAFAPDEQVLDQVYIGCNDDLTMFLRLRVRHEIDAAMMALWCTDLPGDRRPEALRYLLEGRLQYEVLERLVPPDARPHWLDVYDEVYRMLDDLGEHDWRTQRFLAALFPDQFTHITDTGSPEPTLTDSQRLSFFEGLEEWWNEQNVRSEVIESYEAKAWPDFLRRKGIKEGLLADTLDHWLGLLVLGACRSLGRTQAGHHRRFLELAYQEGWWEVFKAPEVTPAWMEMLRSWQDRAVDDLSYSHWMSLFPAIYQLSRYLEEYRRLLRSAGRRPAELFKVTCLLAPRVDEALTGAGQHFDAPPAPLNMGLHWILRELVRLNVVDGDHIFPDCWVPSEQVLSFLRPLGMNPPDSNASNPDKAKALFEFLATALRTERPHLHKAFDIPLCYVAEHLELRKQFGLED